MNVINATSYNMNMTFRFQINIFNIILQHVECNMTHEIIIKERTELTRRPTVQLQKKHLQTP